jgi:hypothetical protein
MSCIACDSFAARPQSGAYRLTCLACCARLVSSARPLRHLQEGHLAAIARLEGSPSRSEILAELQRLAAADTKG